MKFKGGSFWEKLRRKSDSVRRILAALCAFALFFSSCDVFSLADGLKIVSVPAVKDAPETDSAATQVEVENEGQNSPSKRIQLIPVEQDSAAIPMTLSAIHPADTATVDISLSSDKGKTPTVTEGVSLSAPEGLTILNAWVADGFSGNKNPVMTAVLQAYPAMAANEQLSFYAIVGQNKNKLQLDSSPLKENLLEGDSISLPLSDKGNMGTYGIALVKSQIAMISDKSIAPVVEAYESFTLSGTLPATAIAEVTPVSAEIEGEDVLAACDISIFASPAQRQLNQPWQPDGEPIQVTIQSAAFENKELNVYHITANGAKPQLVDTVTAVNGSVSFHADSFSVYVFSETVYLRTYRFYTLNEYLEFVECGVYLSDGSLVYQQTVKNGEMPIVPQNPVNPQNPEATFAGWYTVSEHPLDVNSANYNAPYDFTTPVTTNEAVSLYAKFSSYHYVVFHSQYDDEVEEYPIAFTRRVELEHGVGIIDLGSYTVPYRGENDMVFYGWSSHPVRTPGAQLDDLGSPVELIDTGDDSTLVITSTIHLYPVFKPVYWLRFYSGPSGSGATYYQDTCYIEGIGPSELSDHIPTRDGAYDFTGWYASAALSDDGEATVAEGSMVADAEGFLKSLNSVDGISISDGKLQLSDNVTLYAGWQVKTKADYTIVIRKLRAKEDNTTEYELSEIFTITDGKVGTTVTAEGVYKTLNNDDSYNAVHPDTNVSGESNPYYNYTYTEVANQTVDNVEIAADGSSILYLYYNWITLPDMSGKTFSIRFEDSVESVDEKSPMPNEQTGIAYNVEISAYEPASDPESSREGYVFSGWYADRNCTTRVFLHDPTEDELKSLMIDGTSDYKPYVVYHVMPGTNLTFYAGWEKIWYVVTIDPNYGALAEEKDGKLEGTGATWFWSAYGTKIQEYTTVTRDYVESESGTWYFVNHAGNGNGTTIWPDRFTYYTQDPSKATEFTTFEYDPNVYRSEGWYEVKRDDSEEMYDFDQIVDHNITLKLHWTKVGTFYLNYEPGIGTLNKNVDNEKLYVELDGDQYSDDAEVIVSRTAVAPAGYEFVGWKVRGDASGEIYTPGSILALRSNLAITVQGKRTIFLEATYSRVPTASITYHANGGTISDEEALDYGHIPSASTSEEPVSLVGSYDTEKGTITVTGLVNNSQVFLSTGAGITKDGAVFAGWSNVASYDPADQNAILFNPTSNDVYYVDASDPSDLYAVWQTEVKYHLNADNDSSAVFGNPWDGYMLNETDNAYIQNVYLNLLVKKPEAVPTTGETNKMFRYWATKDGEAFTEYDFSQPVTGPVELYAYWSEPVRVNIHAVDASQESIQVKDSTWNVSSTLSVSDDGVVISGETIINPIPTDYVFAFATVHKEDDSFQTLQEKPIQRLYYSALDSQVHVAYTNGDETILNDDESIYFVYYQQKTVPICYVEMSKDGALSALSVATNTIDTTGSIGDFSMQSSITEPLSLVNTEEEASYKYYSFAMGQKDATNASNLSVITSAANSADPIPSLQIRNTWRGIQYSMDDGKTWAYSKDRYEPALYVLYYKENALPTIVTFSLETFGLERDMAEEFELDYWIEEIRTGFQASTVIFSTMDPDNNSQTNDAAPVRLKNGESFSAFLYTDETTTSRVTVVQRQKTDFTTSIPDETDDLGSFDPSVLEGWSAEYHNKEFAYSYLAEETAPDYGATHEVMFVNERKNVSVEVHATYVNVQDGTLVSGDSWRIETSKNPITVSMGKTLDLKQTISGADFVTGHDDYDFGAIFCGTVDGDIIVPAGDMNVASVAYEPTDEGNHIYTIFVKDENGNILGDLNGLNLYYLYYPKLTIYYLLEGDNGALTEIAGVNNAITYGGDPLTLNDASVTQGQRVSIPQGGMTISQAVENGNFNMPPLLDNGVHLHDLIYVKLGAALQESIDEIINNISDLSKSGITETLTLQMGIINDRLQWKFADSSDYVEISKWPVLYAIYQERGYELDIVKTVPIDTGYQEPFSLNLKSPAIKRVKYTVEGTGQNAISATPANGEIPGQIDLSVVDGSLIRIIGLGAGEYTFEESDIENFTLTANYLPESEENGSEVVVTNSEGQETVNKSASGTFDLNENTRLELTNTPDVICQVGNQKFYTLNSAVRYIEDYFQDYSGTIEMLVDYQIPASDALMIPSYCKNIILTSAAGQHYTITRRSNFGSGALMTNSGGLTLQGITIDGGTTDVDSAIIDNSGTLVIGDDAMIKNGNNTASGGAVNSWKGTVQLNGGTIENCSAVRGGAIYASGGKVEVAAGTINNTTATDGGAIYYDASDTVTISGGTLQNNRANNNGGAVYMASGTANITGGIIGGETTNQANQAKNGGAIYAQNAYVNISGGKIKHNIAENTGGAINMQTLTITISGGEIIENNAGTDGGAIWAGTGSVVLAGGNIEKNTATEGSGGGIYTNASAVSISGDKSFVQSNRAKADGGGIYSNSGSVSVSDSATITKNAAEVGNGGGISANSGAVSVTANAVVSENETTKGHGGGIYAKSGTVIVNTATLSENKAGSGNGGGLWIGSGTASVISARISKNVSQNGSGLYADGSSVTFNASEVKENTSIDGGAIGIGTASKLFFSGNVKITENTMNDKPSNVYLSIDSDAVINATGLGNSAEIGIYVPDTDGTSEGEPVNLFTRHGVPSAFFGTYTTDANVNKFKNDRLPGLTVQKETTSKRLYWGKAFAVEVRYLNNYSGGVPPTAKGTTKYTENNYYALSDVNAVSAIADDLKGRAGSNTAVFAHAFVDNESSFKNYITDVNWNSQEQRWDFIRRDGSTIQGNKLILYYAEPAYVSIENNTEYPLVISSLKISLNNNDYQIINTEEDLAGYGYVFGKDGVVRSELRPVTQEDMKLDPGKSIRILLPGGRNAAYELTGGFTGSGSEIKYLLTGAQAERSIEEPQSFTLSGNKTLNNGDLYEIRFGGYSAVCRIVAENIIDLQTDEYAGRTIDTNTDDKIEYTFSTLNQAVAFIQKHLEGSKTATIEMLVDYLLPNADVVTIPAGYSITFTTAIGGVFKYSDDASARATISRSADNTKTFISVSDGLNNTNVEVKNLIFDGKNHSNITISGGILKTKACDVIVENSVFQNCVADLGGGMYIECNSTTNPQGSLTIKDCSFTNCVTKQDGTKKGGGAIWASVKTLVIEDSYFDSCTGGDQAGAVFHNITGNYESETKIINSHFSNCKAKAGGSVETDAKNVTVIDCTFTDSTATARNGGALNIYSLNSAESSAESHVEISGTIFENCYCVIGQGSDGNGGAFRSTATYNKVENCTFINATGKTGGAIAISNKNAKKAIFTNVHIENCTSSDSGGGIYCMAAEFEMNGKNLIQYCNSSRSGGAIYAESKEFTINGEKNVIIDSESSEFTINEEKSTIIRNCTAVNAGGGIYHNKNIDNGKVLIANCEIDRCTTSTGEGGGIYTNTKQLQLSSVDITGCESPKAGGGILITGVDKNVNMIDTTITDCVAAGDGGGIYINSNPDVSISTSKVEHNESAGNGGGLFAAGNVKSITIVDSSVKDNTTTGNGGGICFNTDNNSNYITIKDASIAGNVSGGMGGGLYTQTSVNLKGRITVVDNRLSTDASTLNNAAGIYLKNSRTLTIGEFGKEDSTLIIIRDNLTVDGIKSDLRLPENNNNVNDNRVIVNCGLASDNMEEPSEIRVVNAKVKLTRFGTAAEAGFTGLSDLDCVFWADDDSLYGIIDRTKDNGIEIIWGADPICKITDANGRLLYLDQHHARPAVFDSLGNAGDSYTVTCAFGALRGNSAKFYDFYGNEYSENTYYVKMLVEEYTAEKYIVTPNDTNKTIVFTTARNDESVYPYRGRAGTRSTIIRGVGMGNNNFLNVRCNIMLQNIVLDGGSNEGISPNGNTRIINATAGNTTVTLGINATLQNSNVNGPGGGVYIKDAAMVIEGGTVRNCNSSTNNGGGVFITGNGTFTMIAGTITQCTANGSGGGVHYDGNQSINMVLSGGIISRCNAKDGGGIYLTNYRKLDMSGGSIIGNAATGKGGGIAVEGNASRIYFSQAPYIYGNTSSSAMIDPDNAGQANNVEMNQSWNNVSTNKTPNTMIVCRGLIRGAKIGIYVPEKDNGESSNSTLYDKHGGYQDPFATFEKNGNVNLNYFINDRNGMKGQANKEDSSDIKIYWEKIYALTVTKQVLSDNPADMEIGFAFQVKLTGKSWEATGTTVDANTDAEEVNATFGEMVFRNGVAEFVIMNGETKTADLLPPGWNYEVTELLSGEQKQHYNTSSINGSGVYKEGLIAEGRMDELSKFTYNITFSNLHAICKLTDGGQLLYKQDERGEFVPAVYSTLVRAFNQVGMGIEWYIKDGGEYFPRTPKDYRIEILIPEYEMSIPAGLDEGMSATLTTADPRSDDGFPYVGGNTTAVIRRGESVGDYSMIEVRGNLTLGDIVLDGNGEQNQPNCDGGLINVKAGGSLRIDSRSTMQNSTIAGGKKGAGIYLAEGSKLYISGAPTFLNNITHEALSEKKNGDEPYNNPCQDIYVDGYGEENAASLIVTGNLTGEAGSIWVWAEQENHYKQGMQFAQMSGGIWENMEVFRNAVDNAATGYRSGYGKYEYLYGIAGEDGNVYWYGTVDLPIKKLVTGYNADANKEFNFTFAADPVDNFTYTKNGASMGSIYGNNGTFTMKKDDVVVIQGIPMHTKVTITEVDPNPYVSWWKNNANYVADGDTGNKETAIEIVGGIELEVTNMLPICKIVDTEGTEHPFETLRKALSWANNSANKNYLKNQGEATIEMLCDYIMPDSDTLSINNTNHKITLTTAAKEGCVYSYRGEGMKATIIHGNYESTMFNVDHNNAEFTLINIGLDGNGNGGTEVSGDTGVFIRNTKGKVFIEENTELMNGKTKGTNKTAGAIYANGANAYVYMNGGTIHDNETVRNGGAIYAAGGSYVNIAGGIIQNNSTMAASTNNAFYGGGAIYLDGSAVLTITGGLIQENVSAGYGGAIYSNNSIVILSENAVIKDNTAVKNGGGIYPAGNSKVSIYGGPTVTGNTAGTGDDGEPNNIYITVASTIQLVGELTGTNPIGVYGADATSTLHKEGDQFGIRTGDGINNYGNVSNFKNDRDEKLTGVTSESIQKGENKIHWGIEQELAAPTGYVTRTLPFLIMMIMGVILLMTGKRRNRKTEE